MPAIAAVGANSQITYVAESAFGVTPSTPSMKTLRAKMGSKFELKRDTITSKEASDTRQIMAMSYGNRQGSGEIPFELSYASFDDLLEATMGGTWTNNVLKVGNTKRSFSMEQQYPDINLYEQNIGVTLTGFSLSVKPNAIIEGSFTHLFADQKSTQYADDGVTTMAFAATTITRSAGSFIADGFAVGDSVMVSGASIPANNKLIVITSLTATVMTASAAGFTVDTAKTGVTLCKTLGLAAAANSNPVFDAFTGTISVDGTSLAIATGIELKLEQSSQANFALFNPAAQSVTVSTVKVSGTLTVRFISNALKAKFLNGTAFDVSFTLGNGSSKSYKFDMSSTYATSGTADGGENELTQTIGIQGIYNATDGSTLVITRYP